MPFHEVNDKDLYRQRDISEVFEITLSECEFLPDFSFSMSFTGISNPKIKGSLRIDGDPGDLGYAIVLSSDNGNVDINSQYPIVGMNGSKFPSVIPLKASILGEEDAIKNKSIKLGDFSATTTFNIYYE
ncbi:fimbrial protein [Providencia alcalifaciens PAL-3]|nr:fimbrial protein [Providencia alcalifaciens PAL-3]EUC97911.1 fimbrial protein [Providencia alcalifaciens PAL-1]